MRISAVVNTLNEEHNIVDCLESLNWVDEIVVVDMESSDKTKDLAYRYTKNVFNHKKMGYVEPARNYAISKTTGDWILVIDADERIPKKLANKLIEIATDQKEINFVRIPRKNIVFGKWIEYSRWWPDYNVRFFRRNKVEWQNEIHSIPITIGQGLTLEDKEDLAMTHYHYNSLSEYLEKLFRYTDVQSKHLISENYQFDWSDLIKKPLSEFLSRYFAGQGYKDGIHGFALSILQAFSESLVYLKVWEAQGFKVYKGKNYDQQLVTLLKEKQRELSYWLDTLILEHTSKKSIKFLIKIKRKLRL